MEPDPNISELQDKLNKIIQSHSKLREEMASQEKEINRLYQQINRLGKSSQPVKTDNITPPEAAIHSTPAQPKQKKDDLFTKLNLSDFQFEKFIGENLINKIGIIVIILGVFIGAKYSIEHNLITPLSRILLGYLTGLGLAAAAFKLKKNYHNFSAVLLSGAMAVFYFDTYLAYGFYDLIPRLAAFAIMLFFTIFTVTAAINYNRQVIAHIGLVGAYAIPLLLSENSGRPALLFTYTAIINAGILFIAFRRYWKPLYYSSFGVTWILFLAWLLNGYKADQHFLTAFVFASIFFAGFYAMFLVYKLIRKEVFQPDDVFVFLINAFVFYGCGYFILKSNLPTAKLVGLFTFINAVVHGVIAFIIVRARLADKLLFQVVLSVVVVFVTIAIPVQLDGNWVTLLWSLLAAALYFFAAREDQRLFEWYTLPLVVLASSSMILDWFRYVGFDGGVNSFMTAVPFFNSNFLTALICCLSLAFILYNMKFLKLDNLSNNERDFRVVSKIIVSTALILGVWFMCVYEISMYFTQWYEASALKKLVGPYARSNFIRDWRITKLESIILIMFSLLYGGIISYLNYLYIKSKILFRTMRIVNSLLIWTFLLVGLTIAMPLQSGFLHADLPRELGNNIFYIISRYMLILSVIPLVYYQFKAVRPDLNKAKTIWFDLFMMFAGIYYFTSELRYLMEFSDSAFTGKAVTILWTAYAAVFIWLGIVKNLKYIRIGAFVIIGITLIKLFFFDITDVSTITKTILFIIVGIILLISSFLYNKFKNRLFP